MAFKLPDTSTITGSLMAQVAIAGIRGILNRSLRETTPKMLVEAIRDDTSIWGEVDTTIMDYVTELPPFIATGVREARIIIETQYGGFKHIVMEWLEADNPLYYNIIKNSPGGEDWLVKQIEEILDGVQENAGKNKEVK
jgi:hypothetical protein